MTDPGDDRDLRSIFARLREEDRRRAPAFGRVWSAAGRRAAGEAAARSAPWRWVAAGAVTGAAALAVASALLLGPARSGRSVADAIVLAESLSSWEAPTDGLLDAYRFDLLDSVPTLEFDFMDLPTADASAEPGGGDPTTTR